MIALWSKVGIFGVFLGYICTKPGEKEWATHKGDIFTGFTLAFFDTTNVYSEERVWDRTAKARIIVRMCSI